MVDYESRNQTNNMLNETSKHLNPQGENNPLAQEDGEITTGSILTRTYFKVLMYLLVTAGYFSIVAGLLFFAENYENCIPEDRNPVTVFFQISPWWVPALVIGGAAAFIAGVIFFLMAAGHVPSLKYPEKKMNWRKSQNGDYLERRGIARLPIGPEIIFYIIGMVLLSGIFVELSSSMSYSSSESAIRAVMILAAVAAYPMIPWTAAFLSAITINIKVGYVGHNTLVYILIDKVRAHEKREYARQAGLRSIPDMKNRMRDFFLIDLAADIICGLLVLVSALTFFVGGVFIALIIYIVKEYWKQKKYKAWDDGFARIKACAHAIACGNYDQKIRTDNLPVDEMQVAEDLNSISVGLDRAVDERMKSEHMQTELITNVSHDIRTPLTSIINYTDLLSKPDITPEQEKEYLAVLAKQSSRLKKLITDLIDASRAKSGKVELHPEMIDPATVITMMAGEYGERFHQRNIDLECTFPENSPARISADARQLGRVFENLFQNMLKYSLSGSRAYVDMEFGRQNTGNQKTSGTVRIIFRNISAEKLHISAEELMQRFVRGDSSRSTEGSGLGLSIVRNLTELMGGTFRIAIDGDLFKAILEFPEIEKS